MELTHDILVNLICSATWGSSWLGFCYRETQRQEHLKEFDTAEDIATSILLSGGNVRFIDYNAEDSDDVNSDKGVWDADADRAFYEVTLKDIEDGIQNALVGAFKVSSFSDEHYAKIAAEALLADDGDFDANDADRLMQIILFREIVY